MNVDIQRNYRKPRNENADIQKITEKFPVQKWIYRGTTKKTPCLSVDIQGNDRVFPHKNMDIQGIHRNSHCKNVI